MRLYRDDLPELEKGFRKEAGFAARLSENAQNWPQEVSSEALKQLPYLSDYAINVNLDRVEPQRGFAFGYIDVTNRTERPELEHEEAGIPHIRIPVVVVERAVKPFSVFVDGETVLPLTEERVRETLFNPATFDLSVAQPRDPSLIEPLMPPNRMSAGMMGGEIKMASAKPSPYDDQVNGMLRGTGVGALGGAVAGALQNRKAGKPLRGAGRGALIGSAVGLGAGTAASFKHFKARTKSKTAAGVGTGLVNMAQPIVQRELVRQIVRDELKRKNPHHGIKKHASLLEAIAPTIREKDAQAFVEKVASDATLQAGFRRSGVGELLVDVFEKTKRASAEDRLRAMAENILPSAITFHRLPGGDFLVKQANADAFAGGPAAKGQKVPQEQAAAMMGEENAQAMQPGDTVTAVSDPVQMQAPKPNKSKVIEEFGQYNVQDMMGNQIMGWVFPETLSWDGEFTPSPIALFTNGSAYAFQDTIAGELVGTGYKLPNDAPRGDGVFYSIEGGEAVCTAPITVGSTAAGPDGLPRFVGTDAFGNQVQVSQQEGLKIPMRIAETEYAIPSSWKFMRLNNQTQLVPDPVQMNKTASARELGSSATLVWNGAYHVTGGCGLSKIASDYRYDLDAVGAEFILGVLGVDGVTAKSKIAEARQKGSVKLAGLKTITPLGERLQESTKVASALASKIPNLRRDLIKEAAALEDAGTVDNLLALNFVNPENLATFVAYLPELEATSEKLAEMLLSAYVGMKELPEGAIERGMKNLEEVIQGLKAVQSVEA